MRHARDEDLAPLAALIEEVRALSGLREKKPGVFYRGPRAFLHFHVDGETLWADARVTDDFVRYPVSTVVDQRSLLAALRRTLS